MDSSTNWICNLAAVVWTIVAFVDCWIIVNSATGKLTMWSLMDRFTLRRLYPNQWRFLFSDRLMTFIAPMGIMTFTSQLILPALALVTILALTLVNLRFCTLYIWRADRSINKQ